MITYIKKIDNNWELIWSEDGKVHYTIVSKSYTKIRNLFHNKETKRAFDITAKQRKDLNVPWRFNIDDF